MVSSPFFIAQALRRVTSGQDATEGRLFIPVVHKLTLLLSFRGIPDLRLLAVWPSCVKSLEGLLYRSRRSLSQQTQFGSGARRAGGEENEADELRRLRRENATLQLENDILKKAAVILGTKPQPKRAR